MTAGPLRWDLATVAAATGGVRHGDADLPIGAVSTDSRTARAGELFVAIAGERHDGHDYAGAALAAGAAAVLVARGRGTGLRPRVDVDDTEAALLALAVHRRAELGATVVAVTGSTGKTSTKDLLAGALGDGTWASPRSFNNEVGVPLTILGAPADARYLAVEVGSRGPGHIASLMPAVRPDVAVITNVGTVHLELFGTTSAIVAGKRELVEALGPDGTAVLPAGDARLHGPHPGRRLTFGRSAVADVSVVSAEIDDAGRPTVELRTPAGPLRARLPLAGAHQSDNAAAATAAALAAGRELDEIAAGLESATGSPWRMEVHQGRFTVVNDAYNANPDSMASALRTVAGMGGRPMAVLGLMAELGPVAAAEHARIGRLAADLGFDPVVVVGDEPGIAAAAGPAAQRVATPADAVRAILAHAGPGAVVLVKGSRAAGLETVALDLAAAARREEAHA